MSDKPTNEDCARYAHMAQHAVDDLIDSLDSDRQPGDEMLHFLYYAFCILVDHLVDNAGATFAQLHAVIDEAQVAREDLN